MTEAKISIVMVTCNRLHLLRDCVEKVVARTSPTTQQVIIWDNASTDGTREYLQGLSDPRIEVVYHHENIAVNAYARAFRLATGNYLLELDDDVIDAPQDWDLRLLEAFRQLPKMGFLAANVIDDGKSVAADILYRRDKHLYTPYTDRGVNLIRGPVGGWCSLTSRKIYDEAGGFGEHKTLKFWREDGEFIGAVCRAGYEAALLADLKVFHASGPAYSKDASVAAEKVRYYRSRDRNRIAKERVKQVLEAIPPIRALNRRYRWYTFMPERLQKSRDQNADYWLGK